MYFANKHSQPGLGVAQLVANAFNYNGNALPLPLEIYLHLLAAAFLMKQIETVTTILGILVSNTIEISNMFSSKVTRLPIGLNKDIHNFYTTNKSSIHRCVPVPIAQSSNRGTFS
jgi:hypothetical protein